MCRWREGGCRIKMKQPSERIIVAITGASGAILGIRTLEFLRKLDKEIHLVISDSARQTIRYETSWSIDQVMSLADEIYLPQDIDGEIASGSFVTDGMLVVPCSIKSLSAIANSYANDLIVRAADVCLKEGRRLLLAIRETPLHAGHLRLMKLAADAGAIIFPTVPGFYNNRNTIDDVVSDLAGRILLRMGYENEYFVKWDKGDGIQK
jgi:flavin prenyltransferase